MGTVKRIVLVLILGVMFLPRLQQNFTLVRSDVLKGAFIPASPPRFSWENWAGGFYQDSLVRNLTDSLPFRPELVRLNNQVDYSLFSIPHGWNVILGKRDNLFLIEYIQGYLGRSHGRRKYMEDKVTKFRRLQDIMWQEHKIFMLLVIPPDKGTFAPEDIPDRFLKEPRDTSASHFLMEKMRSLGLNLIDFRPVFAKMKDTAEYPLMPKTGIHWSDYGAFIAADSMFRYITASSGFRFPEMVVDRLDITTEARNDDNDLSRTMNLIWPPKTSPYAYPVISYKSDSGFNKPAALFVGDSFYWGFYNQGIIGNMFSNIEFWYYNHLVFPESFSGKKTVSEVNFAEAIKRQNVIVIIQVGGGWGDPGTGFIDWLYTAFDTSANNPIRMIERDIRKESKWLEWMELKARQEHIPVDYKIRAEAIYVYNSKLLKTK